MAKDVLLIDGLCGLCTRTGRFISNRQTSPLEITEQNSEEGKRLLEQHHISIDSLVLIRNNKPYIRSAAAIRCLLYMRWNWKWMFPIAWIIPLPLRDLAYIVISKLRKTESKN